MLEESEVVGLTYETYGTVSEKKVCSTRMVAAKIVEVIRRVVRGMVG